MNTKLTLANFNFSVLKGSFAIGMLFLSLTSFSQTITDVFPTRVTTTTVVTVVGTGFNATTLSYLRVSGIAINKKVLVSTTEMTFEIARTEGDVSNGILSIALGNDATQTVNYVQPTSKTLSTTLSPRITEVFTNWNYNGNGYYRSSWYTSNQNTWPDDRHDLIGFTYGGVTYSTGVDDALMGSIIPGFTPQNYKAYSTNGIEGNPHGDNYLAMADRIDGVPGGRVLNDLVSATVYDVLIDGSDENGLDLGTGITNFNQNASIRFFSGNGIVGATGDDIPDLLLTQIAQAGGNDIYYYADIIGNVVGRPIRLSIPNNNNTVLYNWRLDLYRMNTSVPYDISYPAGTSFGVNENRPFRMIAFKLDEFGINATNIGDVNNINMQAGGTADIAFMAYNKAAFDIKSPKIDQFPVSRNVCVVPNTTGVSFNTLASIDGGASTPVDPKENLRYQWYRNFIPIPGATSSTYSLPSVAATDLITYKVRVYNDFGAVDLPVTLAEGGTPTFWNGSSWELPAALSAAGVTVSDADRNLIFSENYNADTNLEGCDCRIVAGKTVTIPAGRTLKLYDAITVEPIIPAVLDVDGITILSPAVPAGEFTVEDNASLIQTKEVTTNENSGVVNVRRESSTLNPNDYVYWSSPIHAGNLSMIHGSNAFQWSVNAPNSNVGLGNYIAVPGGAMEVGRGYIKRVNTPGNFTSTFTGVPNNGLITHRVYLTGNGGPAGMAEADKHFNLIGNPYPSALNADKFYNSNSSVIEGAVYIWTHGTAISNANATPYYGTSTQNYNPDDYLIYNGTASTSPAFNGKIASGQGFFVRAKLNNVDVRFENAMRFDDGQADYTNDQFFRNSEEVQTSLNITSEKQLIWLALTNEADVSTVAVVGYVDGATNGEDDFYDAFSFGSNEFSLFSNVADKRMVIQGRPLPFTDSDQVSLGFAVPSNGIYKIGIDHLKGSIFLDDAQGIYLEDTYSNVVHDLRVSPYVFTATAGSLTNRFVLRYTPSTLSVNDVADTNTFVFIKNAQLNARSSANIDSIQIYDMTGKLLTTYNLGNSDAFNAPFEFSRGVYLATITMENGHVITKKLMN